MASTNADFSQNDPRWAGHMLGFSSWETVGRYGCFVTAMANVAQAQGSDVNPDQINQMLKDRGKFVRDSYGQIADITGYDALGALGLHSHFVEQKNWPGTDVAPASYFDVRTSVNTEVIIMIDYHPETAGVQTHFVRVIGLNTAKTDVEIVDSWDGKRKWLSTISSKGGKTPFQIIWSAGKFQKV
jgi:Peptidase_C39 like family